MGGNCSDVCGLAGISLSGILSEEQTLGSAQLRAAASAALDLALFTLLIFRGLCGLVYDLLVAVCLCPRDVNCHARGVFLYRELSSCLRLPFILLVIHGRL